MNEKPISERTLLIAPAISTSAYTTIGALKNFKEQNIEIDDYLGYGMGGCVLAMSASGFKEEEIQNALKKHPNIESHIGEYIGDLTFKQLQEKTGKNLMIQTTQIGENDEKSALIFSAKSFPDLRIAEACKVSTTLKSPLGVITKHVSKKQGNTLTHNGKTYKCGDGNITSYQIPDLLPLNEYKNSILSTMKFPIHPRSKRIARLMSECKTVLQPKVSYLHAIPPKMLPTSVLHSFINTLTQRGIEQSAPQIKKIAPPTPTKTKEIHLDRDIAKKLTQIREQKDKNYWNDYNKALQQRLNNEIGNLKPNITNIKNLT